MKLKNYLLPWCLLGWVALVVTPLRSETVRIAVSSTASPRVEFGAGRLAESLRTTGFDVGLVREFDGARIVVDKRGSPAVEALLAAGDIVICVNELKPEGFVLAGTAQGRI